VSMMHDHCSSQLFTLSKECALTLFILHTLREHGLSTSALHTVCRVPVSLPCWVMLRVVGFHQHWWSKLAWSPNPSFSPAWLLIYVRTNLQWRLWEVSWSAILQRWTWITCCSLQNAVNIICCIRPHVVGAYLWRFSPADARTVAL